MRSNVVKQLAAVGAVGAVAAPASLAMAAPKPREIERVPLADEHVIADPLRAAVKNRLVHRDVRLARRVARLRGDHLRDGYAAKLRSWPVARLERKHRSLRRELRGLRAEHRAAERSVAVSPALQAIATCESGGNPRAIGGGGAFRGKYQFTYATWAAVGGAGDPAAAPEGEQDRRAAMLYARAGAGQWPVCGR